jgi:hypothetical protein
MFDGRYCGRARIILKGRIENVTSTISSVSACEIKQQNLSATQRTGKVLMNLNTSIVTYAAARADNETQFTTDLF